LASFAEILFDCRLLIDGFVKSIDLKDLVFEPKAHFGKRVYFRFNRLLELLLNKSVVRIFE